MKKLILAPALALAMSAGATAPAHAQSAYEPMFASNPFAALIALLLPAVQKVREAG